jgi:hypothetical protein
MKRTISLILPFIFLFGRSEKAYSATFHTISGGNWNSLAVWLNGQIPPLTGTDSIYVLHNVMYTSALVFVPSCYLEINGSGSLCGHERFIVQSGAIVNNYGDLYGDSMFINGGQVHNFGYVLLSNVAVITNGGSLNNGVGGTLQVGGNFLCSEKPGGEAELGKQAYPVGFFPQPGKNGEMMHCDFKSESDKYGLRIFSLTGELVLEIMADENGEFYVNGLNPGIYFVLAEGEKCAYGKLVIAE